RAFGDGGSVAQAHVWLAVAAAVAAVALLVVTATSAVTARPLQPLLDRLILGELAALAVAVAAGALLLVSGHRPSDPLHLLYAVSALAILPVARFAIPSLRAGRRRWVVVVGAVALVALPVRVWRTGVSALLRRGAPG